MGIDLQFDEMKSGGKTEPFNSTKFLYYSTTDLLGDKLGKLVEELKLWSKVIPEGEVKFTDTYVATDRTIFGLTLKYPDIYPLTDEEELDILELISESFSIFLNQKIEELNVI